MLLGGKVMPSTGSTCGEDADGPRTDNAMINGTKLLNVAGMTRGRRDGILKSEKIRHVVKIGPMHLKGVWYVFQSDPKTWPDLESPLRQKAGSPMNALLTSPIRRRSLKCCIRSLYKTSPAFSTTRQTNTDQRRLWLLQSAGSKNRAKYKPHQGRCPPFSSRHTNMGAPWGCRPLSPRCRPIAVSDRQSSAHIPFRHRPVVAPV